MEPVTVNFSGLSELGPLVYIAAVGVASSLLDAHRMTARQICTLPLGSLLEFSDL